MTARRAMGLVAACVLVIVVLVVYLLATADDGGAPADLTTTSSTSGPDVTFEQEPGSSDPSAVESFVGTFSSELVAGEEPSTSGTAGSEETTPTDLCTWLERSDGTVVALLFDDGEMVNDDEFAYVVPDGYQIGADPASFADDPFLLGPGDAVEIKGELGDVAPEELGACAGGTDPSKAIVVDGWSRLDTVSEPATTLPSTVPG